MTNLPTGLPAASAPFLPDMGRLYWLDSVLLDSADPEAQRPGVVISVPATIYGTVQVVTRSSTDGYGVAHDQQRHLGLNKPGHFSRLLPVQCQLWTPQTARPSGMLDDETLAWVLLRFEK